MRTILVTGAQGFIGRHISRAAALRGDHVGGIGRGEWAEEEWRSWGLSAWYELELTLDNVLRCAGTPDVVFHCAGSASVGLSVEDPAQDFRSTVETTLELLEFLRTAAPRTALVYPSSGAVYGRAKPLPINEDAPLEPISPYGVHKKIAEDLCRSYGRSYGVRVSIVRIFSAYGVGLRKQLLWDACTKASRGDASFGGTGRETRDWVNVEDVARLMLIAGDHADNSTPTVNCAAGQGVEVKSILATLLQALGTNLQPEFSGSARLGDPEQVAGDPSRAVAWGWAPKRTWQDGVAEYARWFRETAR